MSLLLGTKKGPGRYHGQGAMLVAEMRGLVRRIVKEPTHRYPYAQHCGYWKGMPCLAQGDHDRAVRCRLDARSTLDV